MKSVFANCNVYLTDVKSAKLTNCMEQIHYWESNLRLAVMSFSVFYGSFVTLLGLQDSTLDLSLTLAHSPSFLQIHLNIALHPTPRFHRVSPLFQHFPLILLVFFIFPLRVTIPAFLIFIIFMYWNPTSILKCIISEYPRYIISSNPIPVLPSSLNIFSLALCSLTRSVFSAWSRCKMYKSS